MAEITLMGASYSDVPAVELPKTGGGNVQFFDVSDTTALESDVANGKYFYTASGIRTQGTSSGGGTTPTNHIYFIDYDGTILYSYTPEEWANISGLPSNPSHSGLISQGWNWTKNQIDTQLTSTPNQDIFVGQMYITESGNTEIDIKLENEERLSPSLLICVNGTVLVDWGDNTASDTVTGTSIKNYILGITHNYEETGEYTIKITTISGNFAFGTGTSTSLFTILYKDSSSIGQNRVYAKSVKSIRIGSGITSIEKAAFHYCYYLEYITIPSAITSIAENAFYYCYSLESVTIPSNVTSIKSSAFFNCYSLKSAAIPNNVTTIESSTFSYCYSLKSVTIPSNATSIGNSAFSYCHSLKSVTIPSNVTSIKGSTFFSCYSLASIAISSNVTTIGSSAFSGCCSLASVAIPSNVTSIGNSAFYNCHSLASVIIPSNVTSIESNTFSNCYSLKSVTIPSNVTIIKSSAFYYCYSLESVTIPSNVTSIDSSAFSGCYSLASVTIPNNVTSIESGTFSNCHSLASVIIPSNVTSIKSSAFSNCYSLASMTIPSNVTSIEGSAFSGCSGVKEYHIKPISVPTISSNTFSAMANDCVLYVPAEQLNDYKTASYWSSYESIMQGE